MTAWHTHRMIAFDLETTGVDVEECRIVTAAVTAVGGGQPTERPQGAPMLVNPGVEIPVEASAIHGVTTERARRDGVPAPEAVRWLVDVLAEAVAGGTPIVAMNAAFDVTVLDREARRHGVVPLTERGHQVRVIDPFVIDKHVDQYRKGSRRLDALAAHYAVRLDQAHEADSDALAAARVAWRLGQRSQMSEGDLAGVGYKTAAVTRLRELGALSLDGLHAAQATWRASQAASLERYLRRSKPDATVRPEWPLIPHTTAVQEQIA